MFKLFRHRSSRPAATNRDDALPRAVARRLGLPAARRFVHSAANFRVPMAALASALSSALALTAATAVSAQTAPPSRPAIEPLRATEPTRTLTQAPTPANATAPSGALRIVLLLPLDNPLLRRAASTVKDGAAAVFATRKADVNVVECAYGKEGADNGDGVVGAYARCVDASVDWVIGPLGRSDVTALALAKLAQRRPTLMLSPLGTVPPQPTAVLAPDLESEAEAIAQQASEDACRKPVLVESTGALATRVSVAIATFWRDRSAIALPQSRLGTRDAWRKTADAWRRDGVDCVLFAGSGAALAELRPYLRGIVVYVTSASFENALERTSDWTGVRIADAPWLVDGERAEFTPYAAPDSLSPTLARLYALGVDAARLTLAAGHETLPVAFDGAIGQLTLKDAQYRRLPMVGEFRERSLVKVGP